MDGLGMCMLPCITRVRLNRGQGQVEMPCCSSTGEASSPNEDTSSAKQVVQCSHGHCVVWCVAGTVVARRSVAVSLLVACGAPRLRLPLPPPAWAVSWCC
jgi:hypothetical protein